MSVRKITGTTDRPVVVVVEQIDRGRQWWFETFGVAHVNLSVQRVVTTTSDPLSMDGIRNRLPWMFAHSRT